MNPVVWLKNDCISIFADIENAVCAVSSAQFLTNTGWSSLREEEDNDVPFSLYRDEGKTFLMVNKNSYIFLFIIVDGLSHFSSSKIRLYTKISQLFFVIPRQVSPRSS